MSAYSKRGWITGAANGPKPIPKTNTDGPTAIVCSISAIYIAPSAFAITVLMIAFVEKYITKLKKAIVVIVKYMPKAVYPLPGSTLIGVNRGQ